MTGPVEARCTGGGASPSKYDIDPPNGMARCPSCSAWVRLRLDGSRLIVKQHARGSHRL